MAARKTRANFTLSPDNVRAAQEICEERGLKLSTFVDRAIAAYVKQLREPGAPSPLSRMIGDPEAMTDKRLSDWYRRCVKSDLEEGMDYRIESLFPGLFGESFERYIEAKYGDNRLEEVIRNLVSEAFKQQAPSPICPVVADEIPTSPPKASQRPKTSSRVGTLNVPEETRERLKRYSLAELIAATGKDRGTLSMVRTGKRARLQKDTYEKLVAGLERLESQG